MHIAHKVILKKHNIYKILLLKNPNVFECVVVESQRQSEKCRVS